MDRKKYMFQKKVNNGDNSLRFVYVGNINKDNFIYDDIINVIDNCFDKLIFYRDMERNVNLIRTIFSDFDETNLTVELITPNYKEKVRYTNKELVIYGLEHNINSNKLNNVFNVSYVYGRGINFSLSDDRSNLLKYPILNDYKKILNESMDRMYKLNHIDKIEINRDGMQLCEMYKIFYDKIPDFTDENIEVCMQVMVSILKQFGIKLGYRKNYRIYFPFGEKMPISYDLEELLRDFAPFGKVDIDKKSNLSLKDRDCIKIIGDYVRNYVSTDNNMIDSLVCLSTLLYMNGYDNVDNINKERVDLFTRYPEEQINNSIKLVKRIDNKILKR